MEGFDRYMEVLLLLLLSTRLLPDRIGITSTSNINHLLSLATRDRGNGVVIVLY
jgi:hypothetical protein